ncbi:MAG: LAO/AO transport system kinase [Marivirga sp.]
MKRKNRLSLSEYKEGVLDGNRVILSRAITLVESQLESDNQLSTALIDALYPHTGHSLRIGITGVPGVGKSTFIESFGQYLIQNDKTIAVLTVDPSSQRSFGSILGDKTRMNELSIDKNAYIRPSATGDALGGITRKTRESMLLCEAAGYDVILIETVGVGQSETAVKDMVDYFLLLMLAGAGDELQGIKKGIMEMADSIVITKADGENTLAAKRAKREYENALHLFQPNSNGWSPKVQLTSSINNQGMHEVWDLILTYHEKMKSNGYFAENRRIQATQWMHETIHHYLKKNFYNAPEVKNNLKKFEKAVQSGTKHAVQAAHELINQLKA